MDVDEVCARLENVKVLPSGRSARCPAHADRISSLMVNTGRDGGVVMKCHAGCPIEAVVGAIGLTMADLMGRPRHVATYQYIALDGRVLYEVHRWANPKTFRCVPGLPRPAERILYQLSAVEFARATGTPLYIPEGEKDVDRLISLGIPATCNVGGAGAWLPHYGESLAGCHLVVVADNNVPGRAHARFVAAACGPHAASVSLVVPRHGTDVSDLLDAGYGLDALDPLSTAEETVSYRASAVKTRPVRWGWQGYLPAGKLSIVEGDPGDGKSILTVDLAARWSTGAPMPDGSNGFGPYPVILVSAEDDMADTIVPRLIAAGADLANVELFTHGVTPDDPFEFATCLSLVEQRAMAIGAGWIMFDPMSAFLSERTDSHNDASVRRALQPLKGLAERTGAGVTVVRHLNKGSGLKAIYRGGGSIGFTGAARCTFVVAPLAEDPDLRGFACVKSNLARKPPALKYAIQVTPEGVPYLQWRGPLNLDAQSILDGPMKESYTSEENASKRLVREYERAFLSDVLADGPMTWPEIVELGKQEGFHEIGLRRARADMGLRKSIGPGGNKSATWSLRAEGQSSDDSPLAHLLTGSTPKALGGKTTEQVSKWEQVAEPAEPVAIDRDEALAGLPLKCQTCGTEDKVNRYYFPYYVVRCRSHNPIDYHGDSE